MMDINTNAMQPYCNLSHSAKINGGPEKYLKRIKGNAFNKGHTQGKHDQQKTDFFIGIILIAGTYLYEKYISKSEKEQDASMPTEEELKEAEEYFAQCDKVSMEQSATTVGDTVMPTPLEISENTSEEKEDDLHRQIETLKQQDNRLKSTVNVVTDEDSTTDLQDETPVINAFDEGDTDGNL